jgi:hypothetical protein
MNAMATATYKTLFDTFSVTVAKSKIKKRKGKEMQDLGSTTMQYYKISDLILSYTFVAVSSTLRNIFPSCLMICRVVSRWSLLLALASFLYLSISIVHARLSDLRLRALRVWRCLWCR